MDAIVRRQAPDRLWYEALWTWVIVTGSVIAASILTVTLSEFGLHQNAALFVSLLLISPLVAWRLIRRQNLAFHAHFPELFKDYDRSADLGWSFISSKTVDPSGNLIATDRAETRSRTSRSRRAKQVRRARFLLRAIDPSASAVLQLGSLLIVQFMDAETGRKRVVARSLTKSQRAYLRKNPLILNEAPERVVEAVLRA
jgi:hypothetical protein